MDNRENIMENMVVPTDLFPCAYSDDDLLDDPLQIAWNDFLHDFCPTFFCWSRACASRRSGRRVSDEHGYEACGPSNCRPSIRPPWRPAPL